MENECYVCARCGGTGEGISIISADPDNFISEACACSYCGGVGRVIKTHRPVSGKKTIKQIVDEYVKEHPDATTKK